MQKQDYVQDPRYSDMKAGNRERLFKSRMPSDIGPSNQ